MTPILTVVACLYIMWGLAWITWVIFGTWMAIVVAWYFAYGRSHATLNHYLDEEEIAEPAGRRLKEDEQ